MQISPVNSSTSLVEIIQSNSNLTTVKRINQVDIRNDFKNFEKFVSQDQKNAVVSESSGSSPNVIEYNFRIQIDTPLSKANKSGKFFNEAKRIKNLKFYKNSADNSVEDEEAYSPEKSDEVKKGSGYYIVVNNPSGFTKQNLVKNFTSELQKRINNVYHLGFQKEPGTLVDLVF